MSGRKSPVAEANPAIVPDASAVGVALTAHTTPDVPIEIRKDILDEYLAAELLAEEADVAANDRSQIEKQRLLTRRERLEEFGEGLGRENRIIGGARRRSVGTGVGIALARRETV